MNTQQNIYTKEQHQLIAEFAATYGLEPEQIRFYSNDPQPFFDRDATAVLIHKLTTAVGIEDDLVPPPSADAIAVKYRITFEDGTFASSTGIANLSETDGDNNPLTPEQLQSLATSRASRSALRNKGLDLVKLHAATKRGPSGIEFSGPPQTERQRLLREVHASGYGCGYIFDTWGGDHGDRQKYVDKSGWRRILATRYNGVEASSDLTDLQLKDLASFLRSQRPMQQAAA